MEEMLKRLNEKLRAATERRAAAVEARKAVVDKVETEKRDELTEDEDRSFNERTTEIEAADEEIRTVTERITGLEAEEKRQAAADAAAARVSAFKPTTTSTEVREPITYAKGNGRSYIADLTRSVMLGDEEARGRLRNHSQDVREAKEFQEFRTTLNGLNRTDGSGGFQEMAAA